jgi:hypothetical protein
MVLIIGFWLKGIVIKTMFQINQVFKKISFGSSVLFIFTKLTMQSLCSVSIVKKGGICYYPFLGPRTKRKKIQNNIYIYIKQWGKVDRASRKWPKFGWGASNIKIEIWQYIVDWWDVTAQLLQAQNKSKLFFFFVLDTHRVGNRRTCSLHIINI